MYYTYVLYSKNLGKFYIGFSKDLAARIKEHKRGRTFAGSKMKEFKLIYYEACPSQEDAEIRERQLKTGFGRGYLKRRLEHSI